MDKRICSIDGCERRLHCRGWCATHYRRFCKTGSTDPTPRPSPEERFWAKVEKTETCWIWTGNRSSGGYGYFSLAGVSQGAHRLAYEWLVGPIPEGLHLDHLCRNRCCVNPDHLEPVTVAENARRRRLCPSCGYSFEVSPYPIRAARWLDKPDNTKAAS